MGSKTVNPVSLSLTGGTITKTDTGGSTGTILIAPTTAQSVLNFDKLAVVFENYSTTASCTITLKAGDNFSEVGQGDAAAITLATTANVVIGGKNLESARFLQSDGSIEFSITSTATCYVYAVMEPFNTWNP